MQFVSHSRFTFFYYHPCFLSQEPMQQKPTILIWYQSGLPALLPPRTQTPDDHMYCSFFHWYP